MKDTDRPDGRASSVDMLPEALERALQAPGPVVVEAEDVRAEIDVVDVDRIGVVVERLRVAGPEGDVVERAEALTDRLRPGGGRLRPVEVDPDLGGATLRTDPEDMDQGRFYQVDIDTRGAEVSRHRVGPDGRRSREPFTLTRDDLGRTVGGIAGILHPASEE